MTRSLKITILGCGGAGGVPSVAWGWGQCDPDNPRNRRLRPSILVEQGTAEEGACLLIDSSPDLRAQLLAAGVNTLTGVLYTHAHADHIHGLDDLREINRAMKRPLDIWADTTTLAELDARFGYAFEGIPPGQPMFRPWLIPHEIVPDQPFDAGGLTVQPFRQDHGYMETLGFRIGNVAYSTDLLRLPDESKAQLQDLDLWIVGALTENAEHETHASLQQALDWIAELKPKRAVITHMGVSLDYDAVASNCPPGVEPAYDGMVVKV